MILFSVSASQMVGTGHLMRCLNVASCLLNEGVKVVFHLVGDPRAGSLIVEKGIDILTDKDVEDVRPDLLVVDRVPFEPSLPCRFKERGVRIILFDNLYTGWGVADVVINPLPHQPYTCKPPNGMLLFDGPAYMPLGDDFRMAHHTERSIKKVAKSLLISCGGTDPFGVTLKLADILSSADLRIDVTFVVGRMYEDIDALERITSKMGYRIIKDPPSLLPYMLEADLALLTFGLTVYEAACCGLPSLLFPPTKEHLSCAEIFSRYGASINMGLPLSPSITRERIERVRKDHPLRIHMSKTGKGLVDGEGARRVSRILLNYG